MKDSIGLQNWTLNKNLLVKHEKGSEGNKLVMYKKPKLAKCYRECYWTTIVRYSITCKS